MNKLRWHRDDLGDYYAAGARGATYLIERRDTDWAAYRNDRLIETHRSLAFCKGAAQVEEDRWLL